MSRARLGIWGLALLLIVQRASGQLTPTFANVQYGSGNLDAGGSIPLLMDIYEPAGTTPTPTVLWIHGGGWTGGNKNALPSFMQALVSDGITVASINYRLSQEAIFPAQTHDVKGAVRFLRANAATYRVDTLRMGAWGSSAGGHLTALLATTGGNASAEGNIGGNTAFSSRILTGVDYFGPSDLLNMNLDVTTPPGSTINHDAPNSPESRLIGFTGATEGIGVLRANQSNPNPPYPQKVALVTLASPVAQASFDDPTLLIAHGTNDTSVPMRQSEKLFNALSAVGAGPTYWPVSGAGHGNLGATTDADAVEWLEASLRRLLGDANLDGMVDTIDFNSLAANFGNAGRGWRQGDFDSNGSVTTVDFNLLAANFGSGSAPTTLVPEPGPFCAGVLLTLLAIGFRRSPR